MSTRFSTKEHFNKIFTNSKKPHSNFLKSGKKIGKKDKVIINIIKSFNIKNKNCVDIGPGDGRWTSFLKNFNPSNLIGIDFSEEVLKKNRQICDQILLTNIQNEKLALKSNNIDLILCLEVLEHLTFPNFFISELMRVLKPGSIAIFTIPNILSFISRLRVLLGLLPVAIISDPTHVKFYRRKEIIRLFSKSKTEIKFYSSTFSLNIFNPKSKFNIKSFGLLSNLDDSLIFSVKKL